MGSDTVIQVAVSLHETYMVYGESVQKSLSTFHARFQQEKMKVVKADTEDQDFQKQLKWTLRRRRREENVTLIKRQLNSNGSLIIINRIMSQLN